MKAWVITVEVLDGARSPPHDKRVVALVSARKGADFIKEYIENLHRILRLSLETQLTASKYNKPDVTIKAKISAYFDVYLVSLPYILRAQRSEVINITEKRGTAWLKWQGQKYPIYKQNPKTHELECLGQEEPPISEAQHADFQMAGLARRSA
jgi:hypothetical protein